MPERIRIMFVDDEPRVLDGLRRMLRSMRNEWDIDFANGGQEALDRLARTPADVIVSDIRMPGMTGVELLEEVRRRHPETVRIALSGQASRETVLRAAGPTHQYLPKPCDAEALKATIGRLGMLRQLVGAEKLRGAISAMESIPSLPAVYEELTARLAQPGSSVGSIAAIIARDVGMSGKVIQLVSTGFFGPPRRLFDPVQAVECLGMDIVEPLALSVGVFSQFDPGRLEGFSLEALGQHGLCVAAWARRIAESRGADKETQGAAFLAGMLHDVGKLVFAQQFPEEFTSVLERVRSGEADLSAAERQALGATHAQVGAYLLGIWGLPEAIIEATAYHHCPRESSKCGQFTALTAVHAANALAAEADAADARRPSAGPDHQYLAALGLAEQYPLWAEMCRAGLFKETANV